MVRIETIRINGLTHYELYVRDVFYGLYVSRADARSAASRWDIVFARLTKEAAPKRRAA